MSAQVNLLPPRPPSGQAGSLTPQDLAGLMASFTEVTGRLQSSHEALREEVARLTRELGDANAQVERSRRLAALGEMAAGIAHEVRNPLGSIRLYARMLEEDLGAGTEPHATAVKIARAVRGVEGIVGDVLTFAREFRLRPEPAPPAAIFDAALEACRHDGVAWRGVEIQRLEQEEGGLAEVVGDAALLRLAVTNVIRNAFEAMEGLDNRRLTLDAREERIADHRGRPTPHAVLCVRDSGPGVSQDVVSRMFNPFFTTRGAGTGLGLAIVHRIVDAHAGRVIVRNNADVGLADLSQAPKRPPGGAAGGGLCPGACIEIALPLTAHAMQLDSRSETRRTA